MGQPFVYAAIPCECGDAEPVFYVAEDAALLVACLGCLRHVRELDQRVPEWSPCRLADDGSLALGRSGEAALRAALLHEVVRAGYSWLIRPDSGALGELREANESLRVAKRSRDVEQSLLSQVEARVREARRQYRASRESMAYQEWYGVVRDRASLVDRYAEWYDRQQEARELHSPRRGTEVRRSADAAGDGEPGSG